MRGANGENEEDGQGGEGRMRSDESSRTDLDDDVVDVTSFSSLARRSCKQILKRNEKRRV